MGVNGDEGFVLFTLPLRCEQDEGQEPSHLEVPHCSMLVVGA